MEYQESLKFCCDRFKQDLSIHKQARPNIRIIKLSTQEIPALDIKNPYRFFLTTGYKDGEKNTPRRMIYYCPYCGTNLKSFYHSDDYVNEHDHSFTMF